MFSGQRQCYVFKAVCMPRNLFKITSRKIQVDQSKVSMLMCAVFFLGKVCNTCICVLIFYFPGMQLIHWYIQGKQQDQQYPLNLVLFVKLVHPSELVPQQSVVLVLINTNSRANSSPCFFYFGKPVVINGGGLFYLPTCMGKHKSVHLNDQT